MRRLLPGPLLRRPQPCGASAGGDRGRPRDPLVNQRIGRGDGARSRLDVRFLVVGRTGAGLRQEYRVITVDLPGHGQSASPKDGKLSMDLFARAVEAVREEAKADRVVLVGHSMGAPVIRQYAHLYPQRVAGLVAVDGPLDLRGFPPPEFKQPPLMLGSEGLKAREKMIRACSPRRRRRRCRSRFSR